MFTGSFAGQAVAWMLTYLLHSTLLLGLAGLASKPLSRWSVAAEEMVWKLALVGALFTASLQLAAGWQPLAGQWRLADLGGPAASVAIPHETVEVGLVPARVAGSPTLAIPSHAVRAKSASHPSLPAAAPSRSLPSAAALALGAWALGALVLLTAFGRSYLRLGRRLRGRPRVVGGDLHVQLRTLAVEAGLGDDVRLSCSCRVPVPLALGLREPEICVPPRALVGLTEEQQEGMLAHELAHLARRDPFWLLLGQGLSCLLFFQPLNWVARRRLREISEMLSDEWAVARTGRPLSLAGCLAEVAGWSLGSPALPVPSMADRPSSLGRRIRRLLDETRLPESPARRAWLAAAMGILVIAVAAAAPATPAWARSGRGRPRRSGRARRCPPPPPAPRPRAGPGPRPVPRPVPRPAPPAPPAATPCWPAPPAGRTGRPHARSRSPRQPRTRPPTAPPSRRCRGWTAGRRPAPGTPRSPGSARGRPRAWPPPRPAPARPGPSRPVRPPVPRSSPPARPGPRPGTPAPSWPTGTAAGRRRRSARAPATRAPGPA